MGATNTAGKRIVVLPKGDYLFRQNDTSRELYIIKTGSVRIFKTEGSGEIDLDLVGPGMVVGEIASIDGGPRTASGLAVEDTEAVLIPAEEFQAIAAKIPDWFRKIALILVQRLREADERINQSVCGDRVQHAAAVISLITFSRWCVSCAEGFEIPLKFIENELLDLLNMPISESTEILAKLEHQNVLRVDRGRIVLETREALDAISRDLLHKAGAVPST
jgi:CRP/FNR family transcriptional regulator, cyclic AMP receptor protein